MLCLLTLNLQGCLLSSAMTGAQLYYDRNELEKSLDDQNVSYQITTTMAKDPELKDQISLSAATFKNALLLTGQVPTAAQKQRAGQIAQQFAAGRYVFNDIAVGEPLSGWQQTEDSWITTKIKTEIITTEGISPGNFKIVTENRVVYLLGTAPADQAEKVINIAKNTDGVEKVVKMIRYVYYATS